MFDRSWRKHFETRRSKLTNAIPNLTAVLHNGTVRYRNITASWYPFRPSSHVLYFAGIFPPGAVAIIDSKNAKVFLDPVTTDDAVWDGPGVPWEEYQSAFGVDVLPKAELKNFLSRIPGDRIASLPDLDPNANLELRSLLGRNVELTGRDRELALAIIDIRLEQDDLAVAGIKRAAADTAEAFERAFKLIRPGVAGRDILAELEATAIRKGLSPSFATTVTTESEVLHCKKAPGVLQRGELLLIDFGLETALGFSADVTRVWPVGDFTAEQKAIYELVLRMQQRSIESLRIGALFGEIHLVSCRVLTEGLIDLGLLRGNPDLLVERGAHTLFYPHGLGHLLGADVHDMEDLGDLAGYADGQQRDTRFGFKFLRLNRKLRKGMCFTIEPGFYWIPAVLEQESYVEPFRDCLNLERIAQFRAVRGIRIEDNVLLGDKPEVLTAAIPKLVADVQRLN